MFLAVSRRGAAQPGGVVVAGEGSLDPLVAVEPAEPGHGSVCLMRDARLVVYLCLEDESPGGLAAGSAPAAGRVARWASRHET